MDHIVTADPHNAAVNNADAWTVRKVLDWTTAHLKKHASQTPRLDSEILLAQSRGCERIELYTRVDEVVSESERGTMRELVRRRAQSEPVAYLVGHREFFSLDFRVTPDVLIPRPDTETLVMELLEIAKPHSQPKILEIGTGSGCIAVSAAVNHSSARFTATDISLGALQVARENSETHGMSDRIRFLHGDLFEPVDASGLDASGRFEIVVSNPPYVTETEMETLQADVKCHEPHVALVAGPDGLNVIRRLIDEVPRYLTDAGHLLLEIASEQAKSVCKLFDDTGVFERPTLTNDLTGRPRVVCARKKN